MKSLNRNQSVLVSLTAAAIFVMSTLPIYAQTISPQLTKPTVTQTIDLIKQRATQAIDMKIASINKLLTTVSQNQNLSAEQKAKLTTDLTNLITKLQSLKTKIATDTTISLLQTDIKSATDTTLISTLIRPQAALLIAAKEMNALIDSIAAIIPTIDTTKLDAAGQKALTDLQAKLNQAKTRITEATSEASNLTLDGSPANKATLIDVRAKLFQARIAIKDAIMDLKIVKHTNKPPKPSVTGTVHTTTTTN